MSGTQRPKPWCRQCLGCCSLCFACAFPCCFEYQDEEDGAKRPLLSDSMSLDKPPSLRPMNRNGGSPRRVVHEPYYAQQMFQPPPMYPSYMLPMQVPTPMPQYYPYASPQFHQGFMPTPPPGYAYQLTPTQSQTQTLQPQHQPQSSQQQQPQQPIIIHQPAPQQPVIIHSTIEKQGGGGGGGGQAQSPVVVQNPGSTSESVINKESGVNAGVSQPQFSINLTAPQAQVIPMPVHAGGEEIVVSAPVRQRPTVEDIEEEVAKKVVERPWKRLLGRVTPEIRSQYEFGTILGRGSTSIVRQVKEKATGNDDYACKSILKSSLTRRQDVDDVKREIEVMHHLGGHPNIVRLHGVFEDRHNIHLVMDLCEGGELFDHIVASGGYTEKEAATVMRTILGVVQHCHNMGVIHRDIKPENFLWTDAKFTSLRAIDFGLSAFYKPGHFFRDLVGSKYYVAPDVLQRSYTHQADIWSCGVVMYMLLTGLPPFLGDTLHEVFDNIVKGEIDFESPPWPDISKEAKDCIQKMLVHQPKKRWTAEQLLEHDWMKENGAAPDKPVSNVVLERVKGFSGMNRLQQVARKIIARHLPMEEIEGLKHLFQTLDADKSGTITADELRAAVNRRELSMPLEEFEQILKAADIDGDGIVDYNEFVAATLNAANLAKEENLLRAFEHFDTDHSGYITRDELIAALKGYGEIDNLEAILDEVDKDQDGNIDYEEFRNMMLRTAGIL